MEYDQHTSNLNFLVKQSNEEEERANYDTVQDTYTCSDRGMVFSQNKRMKLMASCLSTEAASRDWSRGLPKHIMDSILDNLISHTDYIRFASVCRYWCSVALEDRNNRNRPQAGICRYHHHQLPMLMIPNVGPGVINRSLYSVLDDKVLDGFRLTISYGFRQIGSSFGWLISLDKNYTLNLHNPFSNRTIRVLPPIWKSRHQIRAMYGIPNNYFNRDYLVLKAVLSANPALYPDDYAVMLIHGPGRSLAVSAHQDWFEVESKGNFEDVIYSAADRLFYAVDTTGQVTSFNVRSAELEHIKKTTSGDSRPLPALGPFHPQTSPTFSETSRYLVESCRGYLLQVIRFKGWEVDGEFNVFTTSYTVQEFRVFEFCKTSEDWVEVKSLGDEVLFIGDNSSASVLASDFSGLRPGSIYYSFCYRFHPSLLVQEPPYESSAPFDIGVVTLENGWCGTQLCPDGDLTNIMRFQTPTWLIPTIQEPRQLR